MLHGKLRLVVSTLLVLVGIAAGQQKTGNGQSPRQAIIEMFSGGETPFKRHLTLEMQNKLQDMMKSSPDGASSPLQALTTSKSGSPDNLQGFDIGPILFSFNNPQQHERYEIQIDAEDLRGDEDTMVLSLHLVRNGVEQQTPLAVRFVLSLKRQEGTWRLTTVTLSATLPVGDPRILDQSLWTSLLSPAAASGSVISVPVAGDEHPKMTALRAVRMIGMAEDIYAQSHPGIGFTCNMSDLVNVGKGIDEEGMYRFMDADFADGIYNGYRFTLSGCERKPARGFRVIAEPLTGQGKAYCSDNTNNLRAADDGRGLTCLTSGRIARK